MSRRTRNPSINQSNEGMNEWINILIDKPYNKLGFMVRFRQRKRGVMTKIRNDECSIGRVNSKASINY